LGADPPILLMDEPFGAIDPITRSRLQDEFLKIQEKLRKTIVFVTHDIDEALKMGDRIALIKEGELVQYDTTQDLLAHPRNSFVRDFIGADSSIKRLALMRVEEVMIVDLATVKLEQSVSEARRIMERNHLDSITVVDENGIPRGWLELADLNTKTGCVSDVMRALPLEEVTVDGSIRVRDALAKMLTTGLSRLSVVDEQNRFKGEITFSALQQTISNDKQGFATDGRIAGFDLVNLEDDQHFFPVYNVAPTLRQSFVDQHPEVVDILDTIAPLLDTETMQRLNYEVDGEHRDVEEVAHKWLVEVGLLEE